MLPGLSYDLCSARHCSVCFLSLTEDKKVEVAKLHRCNGCKLVLYCGPKHQKLDWPLHREICLAASRVFALYPVPSLYELNGQPKSQEAMERAILRAKYLLRNLLNRPFQYYEEEITSFPTYCAICFTFKNLTVCPHCEAVAYCNDEHAKQDRERHNKKCGLLQLYYCTHKLQKLPLNIVTEYHERMADLHKWDLIDTFERTTQKTVPKNPTESLKNYQLFATCADYSCIGTICYALNFVEMRKYANDKFIIFVVGATVEKECWFLDMHTKLFFLQFPSIEVLHLYFIGPDAVGSLSDISTYNFGDKERTVYYYTYRGLFQTFCFECTVKPSMIISFNCGFSEFSNFDILTDTDMDTFPVGPNKHDKWFKGLSEMLQTYQMPIIFTSFTQMEADFDYGALQRVVQMEDLAVQVEHIFNVQRNPFRDLRPLRNWNARDKEDIFFRNGYVQGIRAKLKL